MVRGYLILGHQSIVKKLIETCGGQNSSIKLGLNQGIIILHIVLGEIGTYKIKINQIIITQEVSKIFHVTLFFPTITKFLIMVKNIVEVPHYKPWDIREECPIFYQYIETLSTFS